MKPLYLRKAKVNVKSLAAEAQFIRKEEREMKGGVARNELHSHRVYRVREEARAAQLAYAYLRGRMLEEVERKSHRPPSHTRIQEKVKLWIGWELAPKERDKLTSRTAIDGWVGGKRGIIVDDLKSQTNTLPVR